MEINLKATPQQLLTIETKLKAFLKEKSGIDSYTVFLTETGKQAHIILVEYFCSTEPTIDEFQTLRQEINLKAIAILKEESVELAGVLERKYFY